MKKLLCLILVVLLSVSVFAACGSNEKNKKNENYIVSQDNSNTNAQKEEIPVSSDASANEDAKKDTTEKVEIKNDSKNDNSQGFFLILNGTNEESISYHTQNCPLLKDKEIQKTSWEMITMLQFRHCAKCNPPKYEGYVE
jgi:uncharacterized protein YxeA